jgi:hypothetical protein
VARTRSHANTRDVNTCGSVGKTGSPRSDDCADAAVGPLRGH